jgi:putative nucleotidyltransferase with HDIG domain
MSTIETLAVAIDAKDQITHGHIRRVQLYAIALARELGVSEEGQIKAIEAAALLHDMGKLAVPDYILNKPGPLTPTEFERMKRHASIGGEILSSIEFPYPVVPIVRHHHENWDGTGYPDGLKGTEIPVGARVLAVVDCFDALTSDRPYRRKLQDHRALQILAERRGSMYDPLVVDAFVALYPRLSAMVQQSQPETQHPFLEISRLVVPIAEELDTSMSSTAIEHNSDVFVNATPYRDYPTINGLPEWHDSSPSQTPAKSDVPSSSARVWQQNRRTMKVDDSFDGQETATPKSVLRNCAALPAVVARPRLRALMAYPLASSHLSQDSIVVPTVSFGTNTAEIDSQLARENSPDRNVLVSVLTNFTPFSVVVIDFGRATNSASLRCARRRLRTKDIAFLHPANQLVLVLAETERTQAQEISQAVVSDLLTIVDGDWRLRVGVATASAPNLRLCALVRAAGSQFDSRQTA